MKLKALLFRLYKVDSTSQKLSYKDSKVCGVLVFISGGSSFSNGGNQKWMKTNQNKAYILVPTYIL